MQGLDTSFDNASIGGFKKDVVSSCYETIGTPQPSQKQNQIIIAEPKSYMPSNVQSPLNNNTKETKSFQNDYRKYMHSMLTRTSLQAI